MELDSDLHLPPRKRLLAGFKRLNGSSSSSSASNSNGSSSSASTEVQTLILSDSGFENQSQEELVEAARSAAALAVIKAKAARAKANEKALISAKAIAVAKRALELVDSFPQKNKLKKHVPLKVLYSKGLLRDEEEDLACRLQRAIDNRYPRVLRICSGFEEENGYGSKKQKIVVEDGTRSIVTGSMNEVVDSDCSYEELESNRKTPEADSDATLETEESNSFGKRKGLLKEHENGVSSALAHPREDPVIPRSASWKCQELKAAECVKQNKAVRSS